ncbi:MAG: Hsp20/alpha crystallin family protein [Candidatus Schekmanbacteria bacterium]|nr:MAG: Hsp20/alpha crystallin family protein [Candidatus Schekmanbacteria bacterium]
MNITLWNPLKEKSIAERIDEFLNEDFLPARLFSEMTPFSNGNWKPSVDIYEDKKHIILKVDAPGISPDRIDIKVDGKVLTISGEREFEKEKDGKDYHIIESHYGKFSRSFRLPDYADLENIKANYKKGVLRIEVKKKKGESAKTIKVSTEK